MNELWKQVLTSVLTMEDFYKNVRDAVPLIYLLS